MRDLTGEAPDRLPPKVARGDRRLGRKATGGSRVPASGAGARPRGERSCRGNTGTYWLLCYALVVLKDLGSTPPAGRLGE